jgi:hypothetical protein
MQRLPQLKRQLVLVAVLVLVLFVAGMETVLRQRGIQPTAVDDQALWIGERARAITLKERALALVGSSRMQTGVNPSVLRSRTGLVPVQLAIDGSSFLPVLAGLAADRNFRGSVIVGFEDSALIVPDEGSDIAARYENAYKSRAETLHRFDYLAVEDQLSSSVRHLLRSYADGARPLRSLLTRVVATRVAPQNAIVLPDRSRLADYSTVDVASARFNRTIREMGSPLTFPPGTDYEVIQAQIEKEIAALAEAPQDLYLRRAAQVVADAAAIETRGGHVAFVVMPTSGLITQMENKRFPRDKFWDRFAEMTHSPALHFQDIPSLRTLAVPDGSHIDYRDRAALTNAMLDGLGEWPKQGLRN